MENELVVTQEQPKSMMMRKSRVRERVQEDEEELRQMLEEREGAEKEADAQAKEDVEPANAEEKSYKKRYADLRRGSQKAKEDLESRINALESQLKQSTAQEMQLPKSDEDIETWAAEYPDVASIVETIATKKAQEMFNKAEDRLQKLDAKEAEMSRSSAEQDIRKAHPDFDKLREADDFHDWVEAQPKWVQDALYENSEDAASVVRVIDLYKVDNGMTKSDDAAKRKAAAGTIKKGSKAKIDVEESSGSFKESDIAKMSAKEYEQQEEAITNAIRSGKFIYDLSGSAR